MFAEDKTEFFFIKLIKRNHKRITGILESKQQRNATIYQDLVADRSDPSIRGFPGHYCLDNTPRSPLNVAMIFGVTYHGWKKLHSHITSVNGNAVVSLTF